MADNTKRYFWLKLKDDFFRDKRIKKLRRIAGGDTYTIIYLKMQLLSIKNNGVLIYEGVEEDFAEELALELDEETDNVKVTLAFLQSNGMIEETEPDHFLMVETIKCIGSESTSAERVRKHRELKAKKQQALPKLSAKTNAERQRAFRAKKACEEQQHIPLIEDHLNNTRYNGNYYVVMKRDKFKCSICNSTENLCVHHIDGYDPLKPQNNNENKMLVLCRHCHSHIHAGAEIPSNILESIDYYSNGNEFCNGYVTTSNTEIEKELELELEIDKELDIELEEDKKKAGKAKRFTKPTLADIQAYCAERGNNVDPEHFYDYYEANGWKVGKNPMKDWKASVRTWERNGYDKPQTSKPSAYSNGGNVFLDLLNEGE